MRMCSQFKPWIRCLSAFIIVMACACRGAPKPDASQNKPVTLTTGDEVILTPGSHPCTYTVGSDRRTFVIRIPPTFTPQQHFPMLLMLHPEGWSADKFEASSGMDKVSDQVGLVVIYPNGVGTPASWNAIPRMVGVGSPDDVRILASMTDSIVDALQIDRKRVAVAGSGSGAMMAYRLGAEFPDKFAAVAAVSGTIGIHGSGPGGVSLDKPKGPIPVLIIHGTKDREIPYDETGAKQARYQNFEYATYVAQFWARVNGCQSSPDLETDQSGGIETRTYTGGSAPVKFVTIRGGGHGWSNTQQFRPTDTVIDFLAKLKIVPAPSDAK